QNRPGARDIGQEPAAAVDTRGGASAPGLRILVIEDEESIRRFLESVLRQLGHLPRAFASALEGLAAFAEGRFDLVITDLGLPGASGEEVARAIAKQNPQTPVVLLTGWADQLHAEAKPLEGVARVLGKPVTIQSLQDTLDALCPRR